MNCNSWLQSHGRSKQDSGTTMHEQSRVTLFTATEKTKSKTISTIILYMQDIFSIYQGLISCTLWDQKLETDILCTNCLQSAPYLYNLYILKLVNEWQSFIHVICSHSETTVTQCRGITLPRAYECCRECQERRKKLNHVATIYMQGIPRTAS